MMNSNRLSNIISEELNKVIQENIAGSNCYGIPRGLLEYRQCEREGVLIVEKRSVAAYIYRNQIKQILNFINDLIKSGNFREQYKVFTNFSFAKECVFLIYFTTDDEGTDYLDNYTEINNGEVKTVFIRLYVNPYKHNAERMSEFLYHEINHCKDDIQRRLKGKPSLTDILNCKDPRIKYQYAFANIPRDNIAYLVYNVFVDTELNARVSQFYSELERSNTQREQFNKFFITSNAYKTYDGYLSIIERLEKTNGWETRAMSYFDNSLLSRFKSVSSFRSWFLGKAKFRRMAHFAG